jgi:hypothetical protein
LDQLYTVRTIGEIVHVDLTAEFVICLDHLLPLWKTVLEFCRMKQYRRVLIEGHAPPRNMGPIDVYEHGIFVRGFEPPGLRIAFCLYDYEVDPLTHHFASLASAQHCRVRFFNDVETALKWVGI